MGVKKILTVFIWVASCQ